MPGVETFQCEVCGQTFTKSWSDEDARAEYERNFPETQGDPEGVVCDTCYNRILTWWMEQSGRV